MARRDYSEDDDFYTQGFERPGAVSIWVGMSPVSCDPPADVLQDLCGVGYYNLDNQEANSSRPSLTDVGRLLEGISYSASFRVAARARAEELGVGEACWVTVQFDFAYALERISRPVAHDPTFLGVFSYSKT
jgi:hypothetical protein